MRWLGLLLVLVAGRAAAERCSHVEAKVFPTMGTDEVPTNNHLWIRADVPGPYALTTDTGTEVLSAKPFHDSVFLEIDPGPLLPLHYYRLTANGVVMTGFTTGHAADPQLPPPPVVGHLHITDGIVDMPVYSPGATMLHVTIHRGITPNGEQLADFIVPRGGVRGEDLTSCIGVPVALGDPLCFWVSSVGAEGLESGITGRCAVDKPPPTVDKPPPTKGPMTHDVAVTRDDPWIASVVILGVAAVLGLIFVAWRAGRERLYCKVCEPQPIDRVSVAWLARRQLIGRLIALGVVAAAAYFVLPVAALGVIIAADLWRLIRVAHAVATGWPVIADPRRRRAYVTDSIYFQGWIAVRPGDLARVAAAHIPTARVL
jgi:hypothetical protein